MKTTQILLCILFFVTLWQCKKNSSSTIHVSQQKFTVEIISDTNGVITPSGKIEVTSGNSLNFSIAPKFGYKLDSFLVNQFPVIVNGNSYSLNHVDKDYQIKATYVKNLSWYLAQGKWKCDSLITLEPDGRWVRDLMWGVQGSLQFVYTFTADGNYTRYNSGKFDSSGIWSVTGEETKLPVLNLKDNNVTTVWKIEQLDGVYLTLLNDQVPYIGDPNFKFTSWRYKYSRYK